jgi:hypothetical protein
MVVAVHHMVSVEVVIVVVQVPDHIIAGEVVDPLAALFWVVLVHSSSAKFAVEDVYRRNGRDVDEA